MEARALAGGEETHSLTAMEHNLWSTVCGLEIRVN